MRILYLSQYFPPEMGAPAARVSELSRWWVEQGHRVTVLTAFPHHPTGVKPRCYRRRLWALETWGAIEVIRTYVFATPNRGFKRLLSYLSFMASCMLLGSVLVSRPDVLIATSPQLFVGVAGYVLSRIKACAFVFEVRDLWPRGIVEVGAMREGKMFRLLERLERFLYHQADKVVVVTDGMKEDLVRRGIPGKKIWVIPNGVESDVFEKNGATVRQELGLNGKFVVVYVGTHGMTQGLHAVLEAADSLRDHSGVQFLCVGEGSEKEDLVYAKQRRGLANVRFLPQQPRDRARAILTAADAVLVPLRKLPLFEITVPSKLFEGMAAAKPILLGVRGEARRIVEQAGCGYAYDPENGTALADSIRRLLQTPDRGRSMGEAGRSYVLTHYSRREQAERYAALLEKVAV